MLIIFSSGVSSPRPFVILVNELPNLYKYNNSDYYIFFNFMLFNFLQNAKFAATACIKTSVIESLAYLENYIFSTT